MSKKITKVNIFDPNNKPKKQIRTKRICSHPNPLFEKWLKEWKMEAENRGSNMKYNFQKAIRSLQKFPLPLHSGKECMVLASFGNKICSLIDEKLEEYIKENGPIKWDDHIKVKDLRNPIKARRKRKEINNCRRKETPILEDENSAMNVGKKYVPAFRSGGYALLLTLYQKSNVEDFKRFMRKQELIEASQDLCDASFTIPPEGSYYTAWSSMSTLLKKNYVQKDGNPSRYSLTPEGEHLASLLLSSHALPTPPSSVSPAEERQLCHIITIEPVEKSSSSERSIKGRSLRLHDISDSDKNYGNDDDDEVSIIDDLSTYKESSDKMDERRSERSSASSDTSNAVSFTYVTGEGIDTPSKEKAFTMVDEDRGSHMYLIKAKLIDLLSSDLEYHLEDTREAPPGYTYAYLIEEFAPNFCTELRELEFVQKETKNIQHSRHRKPSSSDGSDLEMFPGLLKRIDIKLSNEGMSKHNGRKDWRRSEEEIENSNLGSMTVNGGCQEKLSTKTKRRSKVKAISNNNEEQKRKRHLIENYDTNCFANLPSTSTTSSSSTLTSTTTSSSFSATSTITSGQLRVCKKSKACSEISSLPESTTESSILCTLRPNSFQVILNIDNTEVYGGSTDGRKKCSKDIIIEDLQKNKIDFRVRNLNVGDFLWTCKGFDLNGKEQEVVLPFVVERKRMDDLGQSIRDGRFKEQKFRLKQSGLAHLIYLVEEYGSSHSIMPIPTCEQAITNTQIIDNFTIKMTKDQKESAAYLTIMTRYLQAKFKNKTLHCVARESAMLSKDVSSSSSAMFLMRFDDLNSSSVKNRSLFIREMLAKHLLQINGASVDKVASIVQKYPTPRALVEALEAQSTSSRDNLLCAIKCQKSGRMIDQSVSTNIARIYTWENLL